MAKVKLTELMKEKQLLSFEVFPPKTDKGMENLPGTIEKLCEFTGNALHRYQKYKGRHQAAAGTVSGRGCRPYAGTAR